MILLIILAIICSRLCPHIFDHLQFISIIFINLIKVAIVPVMFSCLVSTIANLNSGNKVRKIIFNSCAYILFSEFIAVTIAIIAFHVVHFSVSDSMKSLLNHTSIADITKPNLQMSQIVDYLFPDNIIKALAEFNVIAIVVFAILIGLSCRFNRKDSYPFIAFIMSMRTVFLNLMAGVMYLAPFAIFVLVGSSLATSYLDGSLINNLVLLSKFVIIFLITLTIHFIWQIVLMLLTTKLLRQYSIKTIVASLYPMMTAAFVTSSSLATLPFAIKSAKKLKAKNEVIDFMLPICASMNFASGMMYEMVACLFFMQVLGIHIDLIQQIMLGLICIVTGVAIGGIPETGMISVISIFTIAHIPLAAIVVLMPLDRILDRIRTVVNITGNTSGCLTVSKL